MDYWSSILSEGMMKPVFYNLFSPEGAEYLAVVESYPWAGGAGLGRTRTNHPSRLRNVQEIMDLRSKGYLVINSIANKEWYLLKMKQMQEQALA